MASDLIKARGAQRRGGELGARRAAIVCAGRRTRSKPMAFPLSAISRLPPTFLISPMSIRKRRKAGSLSVQITTTGGNQNFDTFDTLNIYSTKGNGAAGMSALLRYADERQWRRARFRLWPLARAVRYERRQADYRFLLRPEARFADGSKSLPPMSRSRSTFSRQGPSDLRATAARDRERRGRERRRRCGAVSSRSAAATRI